MIKCNFIKIATELETVIFEREKVLQIVNNQ